MAQNKDFNIGRKIATELKSIWNASYPSKNEVERLLK